MLNPDYIILLLLNAFLLGLTAWVYSEPLTEPEEIFNWLYRWAELNLPWYLFKPLIGCFKCVSGQWAFWFYLYLSFKNYPIIHYKFVEHVFFIGSTIFFALIVNKVLKKNEVQG